MNIKDILLPILLAVTGMWFVQYVFGPRDQQINKAGSEFVAPTSAQSIKPLNYEVDFVDALSKREVVVTTIETPNATWSFSNNGAIVENLTYKRTNGSVEQVFNTITPTNEKDQGAFLVALNGLGATPYYYDLMSKQTENGITSLIYRSESPSATITKKFELFHDSYQLNVTVNIAPKEAGVQARILFPAPAATFSDKKDDVLAIVYGERAGLTAKKPADVIGRGWERPTIFGLEDRYFVHSMVNDTNSFTQRAYFKPHGVDGLQAIIEGPEVREQTEWKIAFYCGPKESDAFATVDSRLESLLDYGWFAPISKPLLYLLKLLYGYVKNYGWAIVLLTLLIKLIMLPLTARGERAAKMSSEVQRKMAYLDQKYKNDPETLNREKAELMKKHGLSMLGCLPLLLQIPVFIGLQRVLGTSLELYKAPFLWIKDLSQSDPYYIFPILVGIAMALQMMQSGNAKQRMTNGIMAIVITAATSTLSAGLTLFIAVNSLSSVLFSRIQKAFKL